MHLVHNWPFNVKVSMTPFRRIEVVLAAIGISLAGCASSVDQPNSLSLIAAKAQDNIQSTFELRLAAIQDVAATIEASRDANESRNSIRPILERALENQPAAISLSAALEPNGFGDSDKTYAGNSPENDKYGRYAIVIFKDGTKHFVQSLEMDSESGRSYWYDPILKAGSARLVAPVLYPIYGKDTPTLSAAAPLTFQGKTFGVVAVDFPYTDLVDDLQSPEVSKGNRIYLITDEDIWVVAPFSTDIGYSISDRRTGSAASELVMAYLQYRADGRIGKADWKTQICESNVECRSIYFAPIQLKGQDIAWTLIVSAPQGVSPSF